METVAAPNKQKKKLTFLRVLLRILLAVLILVIVLIAGLVIYLSSSGFAYDDVEAMAASAPMPFEERYSFSASDSTVTIACDEADLWWLFQETGAMDALQDVQETLAPYNATLTNFGLSLENEAPEVYAEATVFGFLKVPVKAVLSLHTDNAGIYGQVEEAWLGKSLQLPLDSLLECFGLTKENLVFYVERDIHPRLKHLSGVSFANACINVTTQIGPEMFEEAEANMQYMRQINYYACLPVSDVILESKSLGGHAAGEAFQEVLRQAEADPKTFLTFRMNALATTEEYQANLYLRNSNSSYLKRFLPEVTEESVGALRDSYLKDKEYKNGKLQEVMEAVYAAHQAHEFSLDVHDFVYLPTGNKLNLEDLLGKDWLAKESWFDESTMRVVFANNIVISHTVREHDAPYLSELTYENKEAIRGLDKNKRYPLAIVAKVPDGTPLLLYMKDPMLFTMEEIPVDEYNWLMSAVYIPFIGNAPAE